MRDADAPGRLAPVLVMLDLALDLALAATSLAAVLGLGAARRALGFCEDAAGSGAALLLAYAVLALLAMLGAARGRPGARRLRRWLGVVALLGAVWTGGPLAGSWVAAGLVVATGIAWTALLLLARADARVAADGEPDEEPWG